MATRPPCPCRLWTRDAVAATGPPPCQWRAVAITTTITRRPRHWAPCPRVLDERAVCNSTASGCPRCRPLRPRPCPRRDPQETGEHLFKIPILCCTAAFLLRGLLLSDPSYKCLIHCRFPAQREEIQSHQRDTDDWISSVCVFTG